MYKDDLKVKKVDKEVTFFLKLPIYLRKQVTYFNIIIFLLENN